MQFFMFLLIIIEFLCKKKNQFDCSHNVYYNIDEKVRFASFMKKKKKQIL